MLPAPPGIPIAVWVNQGTTMSLIKIIVITLALVFALLFFVRFLF
jgi:hypothetical protein